MFFLILSVVVSAVGAVPTGQARIVGGAVTSIQNYRELGAMLYSWNGLNFWHECGGIVLSSRAIISAAHCPYGDSVNRWRIRLGSTWANSGGTVYSFSHMLIHPNYNHRTCDSDIVIMRTSSNIVYSAVVHPAFIATSTHQVADNQALWAVGWGAMYSGGPPSEQLRHVQVFKINQRICNHRYGGAITENMLCSGVLDVGGRDQCQGDSGGPLYHNGVVVGVCSWGTDCAHPYYPGVNTRLSRFYNWIRSNV